MKRLLTGLLSFGVSAGFADAAVTSVRKPEWFENAKFGIFCHWGVQCAPEHGDWYGRDMYDEKSDQFAWHREHYGDQKEFGLKDFIPLWKAENWNPSELAGLFKKMGATYLVAMANHHDNFDNWPSTYQPWNSAQLGPKRDIIGGWAAAAEKEGLRFGVSVHASHAWTWFEVGRETGDTLVTKADGKGKWWDGLDPQLLYRQQHEPSPGYAKGQENPGNVWNWGDKAAKPSDEFCENVRLRTMELLEKYRPDLLYFDDTIVPFNGVSDVGWRIVEDFHALNASWHGGKDEAVIFGKLLSPEMCDKLTRNIERGTPGDIMYPHWQTDTCIGNWHYHRDYYTENRYRGAAEVLRLLIDIVSKNGNLLLSIPIRSDGTIDEKEREICEGVAEWMAKYRRVIFDTVPWEVCGEGPQIEKARACGQVDFNEGQIPSATAQDVRYLKSRNGKFVFAIALVPPWDGPVPEFAALKGKIVGELKKMPQIKDYPAVWVGRLASSAKCQQDPATKMKSAGQKRSPAKKGKQVR